MDPTKPQAAPEHPGHETRDVNLRLIVISLLGLTLLIIVSLLAVQGLLVFLNTQQAGNAAPLPPLAQEQMPPEPRLQASPVEDLSILRAEEDAVLNNYGWVNKEAGVVHIPIERAMELTIERGLPVRSGSEDGG